MKIKATRFVVFIFLNGLSFIVNAQALNDIVDKIDIKNLKNQSYLIHAKKIKCDSTTGTTLEDRICANLELQKQDSLLQFELRALIIEMKIFNDTTLKKKIKLSQDIWERYRYAHCANCVEEGNRFDMILFMRCAAELTIKRREDIKKLYGY